jgi:hypothetical protein
VDKSLNLYYIIFPFKKHKKSSQSEGGRLAARAAKRPQRIPMILCKFRPSINLLWGREDWFPFGRNSWRTFRGAGRETSAFGLNNPFGLEIPRLLYETAVEKMNTTEPYFLTLHLKYDKKQSVLLKKKKLKFDKESVAKSCSLR